jgi:hypothetical protein
MMTNRPIRKTSHASLATGEMANVHPQAAQTDRMGPALARIYARILAYGASPNAADGPSESLGEVATVDSGPGGPCAGALVTHR